MAHGPEKPEDFATTVVHAGVAPDPSTGAIMTPIFQTSTYVQSEPGVHQGYDYSRADNPTREALERSLAALEDADYGLAFSSGLAAEQAIIHGLATGDHVLVCDDVYGGTGRLFRSLYEKFGLSFHFVDLRDLPGLKSRLTAEVKMIWIESPSNPLMKIIDIAGIAGLCQDAGRDDIRIVVDNTFASPMFQKPLSLGADIVMHSSTKYIGGHSDIIGGAIMCRDKGIFEELKYMQFAAGAVPGPFECFLLLRSIKTLAVRMRQHHQGGLEVGYFLEGHDAVAEVFHPGMASHPDHDRAKAQMSGYSGMLSFKLRGAYPDVVGFMQRLEIFSLAESLGGVESLVNHPEKMTHASVPAPLRKSLGIDSQLVRLSVGIESSADLIADLSQALGSHPASLSRSS